VNYTLPRAVIESIRGGCNQFMSEGILTKTAVQVQGPNGVITQDALNDNRRFEGWRKTA
jgi:hypothetical protein